MFKKILVPIDGSKPSDHALVAALDVAEKYGSTITLMHVIEPLTYPISPYPSSGDVTSAPFWIDDYYQKTRENSKKMLNEATELAKKRSPNTEIKTTLDEGRPARHILIEAENHDLIIIGSRGLGEIRGIFLGSVSHQVVNEAKIPVLVVK